LKGGISAFCAWNQPPIIHFLLGTGDLWFSSAFAFSRVRGELRLGGGKSVINEDNILAFSLSRRWKSSLSLAAGRPRESVDDERRKTLSSRCGKANIPARNRGRKQHETGIVAQLIADTVHSKLISRFCFLPVR
jgi:hypothetical protein